MLEYYVDQTCSKRKGVIDLDQCEQVDAGLQLEIRKENYEHMFDIRTTKRVYYLVAKNEDEMNKWVDCICSVCGLKMEAIQNELALLPPITTTSGPGNNNDNENNNGSNQALAGSGPTLSIGDRYSPQPQNDLSPQHSPTFASLNDSNVTVITSTGSSTTGSRSRGLVSSQQPSPPITSSSSSSPSESSRSSLAAASSLNYIQISECYTGKLEPSQAPAKSPPPRPPKPRTLQPGARTQSSLALCSQDQSPQPGITAMAPPTPGRKCGPAMKPPPVPSNGYELVCPTSGAIIGGGIYANNNNNHNDTLKALTGQHSKQSSLPGGTHKSGWPLPPAVNRESKPQRCRNSSQEANA